jgi:hypothetical protein
MASARASPHAKMGRIGGRGEIYDAGLQKLPLFVKGQKNVQVGELMFCAIGLMTYPRSRREVKPLAKPPLRNDSSQIARP